MSRAKEPSPKEMVKQTVSVPTDLWHEYATECTAAKQDPGRFLAMLVSDGLDNLLHRDPRLLHCFRQKKLR